MLRSSPGSLAARSARSSRTPSAPGRASRSSMSCCHSLRCSDARPSLSGGGRLRVPGSASACCSRCSLLRERSWKATKSTTARSHSSVPAGRWSEEVLSQVPAARENRTVEGSPHAHEWRGESRARGSEATAGNVSDKVCGSCADAENGMRREGGPPRLAAVPSREPFKPSKPISQCRREMASPASAETLSRIVSWPASTALPEALPRNQLISPEHPHPAPCSPGAPGSSGPSWKLVQLVHRASWNGEPGTLTARPRAVQLRWG